MAVLRTIKGLSPGQLFTLDGDRTILGRHPDCDVVLEVGAVSRQHAQILKVGNEYLVEDLQSRNGTFVNEQFVRGRQKLANNDQLRICDMVFAFQTGSPEVAITSRQTDEPATMMLDDGGMGSGSTIMSKLDVSTGRDGLRLTVNPEVKLKALLQFGQDLGRAVALNDVLLKLLDSLFTIFLQADRGFVILKDPDSGRLIPKAVKHRREHELGQIRVSRTILNEVMSSKEAILSADAANDARFDMSESIVDFHIHSMMCAPLIGSSGQVLGAIQIDTLEPRQRFTVDDLELLASVAAQAAISVENAQLHEIAVQEELLEKELVLAHKVQRGFLPAGPPPLPGYEFFDFYRPANRLGGDYFDYVHLPGGRLAVVLADVSGKGMSAALLMAKLSAEVRYCLVSEPCPAAAIGRLNTVFCEGRWEDRFITLVAGVLDPDRHTVTIVNAGHLLPLWRRSKGDVEAIGQDTGGLPLGVDADGEYPQFTIELGAGDTLLFYSDGLPDAMNDAGQFYGGPRLQDQLRAAVEGVAALGEHLLDDVRRFVGNRAQSDDICLTCFGRLG